MLILLHIVLSVTLKILKVNFKQKTPDVLARVNIGDELFISEASLGGNYFPFLARISATTMVTTTVTAATTPNTRSI